MVVISFVQIYITWLILTIFISSWAVESMHGDKRQEERERILGGEN